MRQIILICGIPGSGKSYLAKQLSEKDDALIIDDPKSGSEIEEAISNWGGTIIVTDPWFCESDIRARAERKILELAPQAELVWYFFENNPEQCRRNVDSRGDGRKVDGSIRRFSASYRIPEGVKTIPVYNN